MDLGIIIRRNDAAQLHNVEDDRSSLSWTIGEDVLEGKVEGAELLFNRMPTAREETRLWTFETASACLTNRLGIDKGLRGGRQRCFLPLSTAVNAMPCRLEHAALQDREDSKRARLFDMALG